MLLIIGVADAIHMEQSFMHYRKGGRSVSESVRMMFGAMGLWLHARQLGSKLVAEAIPHRDDGDDG